MNSCPWESSFTSLSVGLSILPKWLQMQDVNIVTADARVVYQQVTIAKFLFENYAIGILVRAFIPCFFKSLFKSFPIP